MATAVGLTVPSGAQLAIVQANNGGTVRARWDGTNPTNAIGHELQDGVEFTLPDPIALTQARFIVASGSPTLDCHFGLIVET